RVNGQPVPERRLEELTLAHFPVRSIDQFTLRTILRRIAWSLRSDYNPAWAWHYKTFIDQLKSKSRLTAADLLEAALLYVDIYLQPKRTPHRKLLIRDPLVPSYQRLRYAGLIRIDVLSSLLDVTEPLLGELRRLRRRQHIAEASLRMRGSGHGSA